MSLISLKNFTSPLTNIVNLAAIIVIALVFFIYRYSGGGVALIRKNQPAATLNRETSAQEDTPLIDRKATPVAAIPARPIEADSQLLDELLEKRPGATTKKDETTRANSGSALDDIAKQLGVD